MDGAIDREIKDKRMAELLKLQDAISLEKNLPYQDTVVRVITDSCEIREGHRICSGRTLTNKLVYFESDSEIGEYINVKITKACPYHLLGEAER